ncbi:MAG: flagellar hook-basal body complex protein FliE [Bdellovibrionales bacterium]|nr:flagellar hook-basal body complex protein FliE [Bdellovibrionales bacterium]
MSVETINGLYKPIRPVMPKSTQGTGAVEPQQKKGEGFGDMLSQAIKEVDAVQKDADNKIAGLITGNGVETHEAMIALEKADITFQLMNQIRGKIVRAYEEILRTQM